MTVVSALWLRWNHMTTNGYVFKMTGHRVQPSLFNPPQNLSQ